MNKEKILEMLKDKSLNPVSEELLLNEFGIGTKEDLEALVAEGLVVKTKKGKYITPEKQGLVLGTLETHEQGFAFFKGKETGEEFFVANKNLNGGQNRDIVLLRPIKANKEGKNREGQVEKIIEANLKGFVGTIERFRGKLVITSDDKKIFGKFDIIDPEKGLEVGDKFLAGVVRSGSPSKLGLVNLITPLEAGDELEAVLEMILLKFGLDVKFPSKVEAEADIIPQIIKEPLGPGRKDLTKLFMVTIDGEDARDFDDAVSLTKLANGNLELGVHIADVSHYVVEGSHLDKEAFKRGTSTYFPDRVIPMLPFPLSNGICSLNANEDRFAMSAMMEVDKKGKVVNYEITPSLIKVNKRMTYTEVAAILAKSDLEILEKYKDDLNFYEDLFALTKTLTEKRLRRGSILFDLPELKVLVDKSGNPYGLTKRIRNDAESLIEECMLLANETVAEHLFWLEVPCVYRVHEKPPLEDLTKFNEILKPYGLHLNLKEGDIHSKDYQKIVEAIKDHPMKEMITNQLLRSMSHARYDTAPLGHFGLAVTYYAHFTSPIRRYPDLMVHRALKATFRGNVTGDVKGHLQVKSEIAAKQSSEREVVSEQAERESTKVMVVAYMKQFVGEDFEGRVAGMIGSGLFVELDNMAEGFIPFGTMDDYFSFDETNITATNKNKSKTYKVGDRVKVKLVKASIGTGHLDFILTKGGEDD